MAASPPFLLLPTAALARLSGLSPVWSSTTPSSCIGLGFAHAFLLTAHRAYALLKRRENSSVHSHLQQAGSLAQTPLVGTTGALPVRTAIPNGFYRSQHPGKRRCVFCVAMYQGSTKDSKPLCSFALGLPFPTRSPIRLELLASAGNSQWEVYVDSPTRTIFLLGSSLPGCAGSR